MTRGQALAWSPGRVRAGYTARVGSEPGRDDAALERGLRDREAWSAVEAAAVRSEQARARVAAAEAYPRLGKMLLEYQLPTLIVAVVLAPVPLALVLVPPIAVFMVIAGLVGYARERRLTRRPEPPDFAATLVRHQLCAGILLQLFIVATAWFMASVRLFGPGGPMRMDDFWICLAIGEGLYVVCVALPLWLVTARRAHRHHQQRWRGRPT